MALKKETIKQIAEKLKLKEADLQAAIDSKDEVEITIDDKLEVLTSEEFTTLKTNEYNSGKKAGEEMAVKGVKEELKLDFQGKTVKGLVEAAQKKAIDDAKITPDKKVQELTEQLQNIQKTVAEKEQLISEKDALATTAQINTELLQHIPPAGENDPALGPIDIINLAKASGYEFKLEDGKVVPYINGKKALDKVSNVLPVADVLKGFIKDKKLRGEGPATPGGRGGGDGKPPAVFTKLSELKRSFTDQGKSLMGEEFQKAYTAAVAANKDFDLNN